MFFTFRRFWGHFTNHMGQKLSRNYRKSTKNGVGRHHFRDLFGPFWAPTWAHLGPNWPIWSHHYCPMWYRWKKLLEMLKSAVFQRRAEKGPKNLYSRFSPLFFSGVDFYGFSIFSYNFQPIWIILFAFSSQSDGLTFYCFRILNFYPKTKWRPFDFEISKKKLQTFRRCHFGLRWKFEILKHQKVSPSDCEENAKRIIQIGWKL